MKNVAFIFARGGSKGIRNKNIIQFYDKPLIAHTISLAQKSNLFEDIVVSTDDENIRDISLSYGASVPFIRPNELATDTSNEFYSWKHAIENYNKNFDTFISLPCTSPLRDYKTVDKMIDKYHTVKCDLLLGVTRSNHIPNFNIVNLESSGKITINGSPKKQITRRQDAPNCYNITTYAYITNSKYILKASQLMDGNIYGYELNKKESIDIDDVYDFKFAEYLFVNDIKLNDQKNHEK